MSADPKASGACRGGAAVSGGRGAFGGPAISVTGVTAKHARRAIKWLKDRNLLAWFRPDDHSINAFAFEQGPDWTDDVLRKALAETRNGANYIPVRL